MRSALRNHPHSDEPLEQAIRNAITLKPKGHDFDYSRQTVDESETDEESNNKGNIFELFNLKKTNSDRSLPKKDNTNRLARRATAAPSLATMKQDADDSSTEDPFSDTWIQNIVLNIDVPVTDWWRSKLSVGHSTDDSDNIDSITGNHKSDFRTQRENVSWQNDFSIAENQLLTVGYDFYDDD